VQVAFERLELKYLVDPLVATQMKRVIEPHCVPDKHNGSLGAGYWISSLYFDSMSLALFRANQRSDPDRLKLRARIYRPDGDVHLEVKRKRGDVVSKQRAIVARATWVDAAQGFGRPLRDEPKQERILGSFAQLLAVNAAEPTMVIEYEREAFVSPNEEYARISFDRGISAFPTHEWSFDGGRKRLRKMPMSPDPRAASFVLVELKCETMIPSFMVELIRRFELNRVGYSK